MKQKMPKKTLYELIDDLKAIGILILLSIVLVGLEIGLINLLSK